MTTSFSEDLLTDVHPANVINPLASVVAYGTISLVKAWTIANR